MLIYKNKFNLLIIIVRQFLRGGRSKQNLFGNFPKENGIFLGL